MTDGSTIAIKSYAKINLSIDILGRLPNGYHSIRTVMQQVDLFDTVRVSVREGGANARIALSAEAEDTDISELPTDERNIAVRAARVFLETFVPRFCGSIAIHLRKRIPLAAGLAGGSGNAAAVILALARLLGTPHAGERARTGISVRPERLMELGLRIGADVPFCILGQAALNRELGLSADLSATCALAEGMGERLTPLPSPRGCALIVKPAVSLSTAAVYAAFDHATVSERPDTDALVDGIRTGDCAKIRKNMINVLEIAVIKEYPEIADTKKSLASSGEAECALMSGSGSSVFAWYRDRAVCALAYGALRRAGKSVYMAELLPGPGYRNRMGHQ
jgi:4-diphosphocytidyl-2-C-methyl-D-erythritol kinase